MFFTPFAFVRQPFTVTVSPAVRYTLQGMYIGGNFTSYGAATYPYFRVLDSTGSISSSFNIGTGFASSVFTAVTQSDGKILAGGNFNSYSGSTSNYIARLNTNGTLDTTFKIGSGFNSNVNAIVVQPDGKIVASGVFGAYSGSANKNFIARINTDGTADTGSTWNQGVGFSVSAQVPTLALQSDGKILAGGTFTSYSGSGASRIARINTDGTIDTGSSWNSGAGFNTMVYSVAVQSDQKIIAAGQFTTYSGSTANYIVRLNTSGTIDTSFNTGTGFNTQVNKVQFQSDGKLIAVGNFITYSGSTANRIVRLNTSGTIDTSFNTGTGFGGNVNSVAIQPDGKILAQGVFTAYSGSVANGVARLNTDGTLDTTFNRNLSINTSTIPTAILPLSNGTVIIGGNFAGNKIGYATYLGASGSESPTGSISLLGLDSNVQNIILQTDNKVVIGGSFTTISGSQIQQRILRLNSNGTLDNTFNPGVGTNGTVVRTLLQSDGKIVLGGSFTSYSGSAINRIVRINNSGSIDTAYKVGTGTDGNIVYADIQSDNKVVAVGLFANYSGSGANRITRINTDGTIDTGSSWNSGAGFQGGVSLGQANTVTIQPDGKILVGGTFTTYSGSSSNFIARINTNGTLDSSFKLGTGFNATPVNAIAVQSDGKIVAGGGFTSYSGSGASRIARINTDGTIDSGSSWNSGVGFNSNVLSITIQSDGKVVVGGGFSSYSGSAANRIVRLNTDGSIDTTFVPTGSGFNNNINTILPIYSSSFI